MSNSQVSHVLSAIDQGDPSAASQLLPLVYDELRKLAAYHLDKEQKSQTLEPTALVHEAYLKILGGNQTAGWKSRGHFFAAAAESMRRILIDNARRKNAVKHGGDRQKIQLEDFHHITESPRALVALDEALVQFETEEPDKANLVKLRFFAGLTTAEAAELMNISVATAERWWSYSRVWLLSEIDQEND
ncbi:MAG: ECF-type sigma factor [Gemmatales bacterium]